MNKILPYIVIAILLGTVTMVVPYVLLGPSDYTSMTEGGKLIQPSPAESEQPSALTEPSEAPEAAITEADLIIESLSNLSPIGLITIPSFLIALGAFIYLKKRRA